MYQKSQLFQAYTVIPTVAFDPQGRLVVAYATKNVARRFYYDPAHPNDPIYTKVERVWWAVRRAQFPQA